MCLQIIFRCQLLQDNGSDPRCTSLLLIYFILNSLYLNPIHLICPLLLLSLPRDSHKFVFLYLRVCFRPVYTPIWIIFEIPHMTVGCNSQPSSKILDQTLYVSISENGAMPHDMVTQRTTVHHRKNVAAPYTQRNFKWK